MSYQSLIDDAISRARVKVASGLPQPTDKLASVVGQDNVLVEAEKLANALEYLSLSVADDGTAVGAARADMVRDFFKTAAEADKKKGMAQPLVTETSTSGTQSVAPQAGKAKLNPQGLVSGNSPKQTTAPDGAMSRNALEQTPSASPTKSASLYDMLMGARMAKIADDAAAPRQMDAEQRPPAHPMGQEGGHAQSPLSSTERIVAAKRKELHAPSRARLSEILAHASDTAPSMASAHGIAPQAAAKGGLKVAYASHSVARLAALGGLGGAVGGAGIGALTAKKGERGKGAARGALVGGLGGALTSGLTGHAAEKIRPGLAVNLAHGVPIMPNSVEEMAKLQALARKGNIGSAATIGAAGLAGASTRMGKKTEEASKSAAATPAQIAKAVADAKKEEEEKKAEKAEKKASVSALAARMQKEAAEGEKAYNSKNDALRAALGATVGSSFDGHIPTGPILAAIAAEKNKGSAALGSAGGSLGGALLGSRIGGFPGAYVGRVAGSGLGAYGAHRMASED